MLSIRQDTRLIGSPGNFRIQDLDTLIRLYEMRTPSSSSRALSFTIEGANVVNVYGSDVRTWSPASLVRKQIDGDESTGDVEKTMTLGQFVGFTGSKITAICAQVCSGFL